LHLPGTNFLGPGTDIEGRIDRGVTPTTHIDEIAMQHDLDYITNQEPIKSDIQAIAKIGKIHSFSELVQAIVMTYGLTVRSSIDLIMHLFPFTNITHINKPGNKRFNELTQKSKLLKPSI